MGKNSVNENVNVVAENAVVTLLDNLFKDIAYIDVTTVRRNIGYASEGGMTKEDRMIRVETANYFMKHFAVVYLGLVINAELRDEFIKAIQLEMGIDNISEADRKKYRAQMKPDEEDMSKGNYLIDLSSYNDAVYTKINKKILLSMQSMAEFDDGFDAFSSKLTQNDMINIGFIVSNFMYLLRAIGKNQLFVNYVKEVVRNVEAALEA
jgi:hypothetical protein